MGKTTGISWTHSTFNPWRGCQRVSPGCENCYAETLSKRNHALLGQWGSPKTGGTRIIASPAMWREPLKWNAAAAKSGKPHRVFCASLADVFEDLPQLDEPRAWLWALIESTPHLTWLLLTKRPENVLRMAPRSWVPLDGSKFYAPEELMRRYHDGWAWPSNVWLGTTVEDNRRAIERIPHLLDAPAHVRFLSVEPQLEAIKLEPWFFGFKGKIHWVIQGGESGPHARPFDLTWADSMRAQCAEAGVAYFFKQTGSNVVGALESEVHGAGDDPQWWPEDLRVQQFPQER